MVSWSRVKRCCKHEILGIVGFAKENLITTRVKEMQYKGMFRQKKLIPLHQVQVSTQMSNPPNSSQNIWFLTSWYGRQQGRGK